MESQGEDSSRLILDEQQTLRCGTGKKAVAWLGIIIEHDPLRSRAQLEEKLYSWRDEVSSNAVEVYIHGLRKKLGSDLIQNVRGVGYMVPKA